MATKTTKQQMLVPTTHDVTKIQSTELSILLRFYFHGVLERLKTNFQTNFAASKGFLVAIEYAWIFLFLEAFAWRNIYMTAERAVI